MYMILFATFKQMNSKSFVHSNLLHEFFQERLLFRSKNLSPVFY